MNISKKLIILFIFCSVTFSFLVPLSSANAALPTLIPTECRGKAPVSASDVLPCESCDPLKKNREACCCDLGSVELMAINVAQIVVGITGSILLLMFVIGGAMFTMSGGQPDKVKKATEILKNSVIGLVIILLAGAAIRILLKVLSDV
jgi:hypothetical protein